MNNLNNENLIEESDSPLWMVTTQPNLTFFVNHLTKTIKSISEKPSTEINIKFSRSNLKTVKDEFNLMITSGEEILHKLANLLCSKFLSEVKLQSVVIGEVVNTRERFTLMQSITKEDLMRTTDLDLGNRQLSKLQIFDGINWVKPLLVSNVVEYQPGESNKYLIHKLITRIKAEEEIWNKVVDEIFDIDSLIKRDKKLEHLSRYVKDIFGLKVVVENVKDIQIFHNALKELQFQNLEMERVGMTACSNNETLKFIETKDYTLFDSKKTSGWEAMKSVIYWNNKTLEIQIQALSNYLNEREVLTKQSHSSFKINRDTVRNELIKQYPLFGFCRDLLKWLFSGGEGKVPEHGNARVVLED